MKTLRVGFVGFGFIGKVHAYGYINLPLFYNLPLRTQITHVCTSSVKTAAAAAEQIGAQHAVTDFRAVTENPDVDVVHICTPNHLHREALLSAMAVGKHIYCDKPLTATLAQALEIEAALPAYKGTAQMTLQNRFFPATMRAKQLMEEGFVGRALEFRAAYLHSGSVDEKAPLKWKLSASAGGGVIADLGSHVLDLMHWLLGDYEQVFAATQIAHAQRPSADDPSRQVKVDAEDSVMLLAKMACGALGTIEASKIATGAEDEMRFEIHGTRGALRFNGMDPHHLEAYDLGATDKPTGGLRGWTKIDTGQRYGAPATGLPGAKMAIGWTRAHMACLANFVNDIAQGKSGDPDLWQGIYIQKLIDSVGRSATARAWTKV
ncbi:MAG: Gfo/Idh/MocA family oxidoreductase [Planctomycetaceae bacterium]|nr:Gfo/Idh/MocA family oxidoreductase [Planctomycetaceae bacterium]